MIIDIEGGLAYVVALSKTPAIWKRRSLDKTAGVLLRDVILVCLPSELMSYIRSSARPEEDG